MGDAAFRDPIQVQYASTAYFSGDSVIIPTPDFLSRILEQSLDDPQVYLDELSQLSNDNIFSTATNAIFAAPDESPSSQESTPPTTVSSTKSIPGIVGAAVGFTLLVAGLVFYSRSKVGDDNYRDNKLNKKLRGGDGTVAGETYAGETLDGTASISPSIGRFGDEENTRVNGCTAEEDSVDTSSTPALWGRLQSERSDNDAVQEEHIQSFPRKHPKSSGHSSQNGRLDSKTSEPSVSRKAMEDFDASFIGRSKSETSSMSEPSYDYPLESVPQNEAEERPFEPVDSVSTRLRNDNKSDVKRTYSGDGTAARRPRTVAEIEMLLAMDTERRWQK